MKMWLGGLMIIVMLMIIIITIILHNHQDHDHPHHSMTIDDHRHHRHNNPSPQEHEDEDVAGGLLNRHSHCTHHHHCRCYQKMTTCVAIENIRKKASNPKIFLAMGSDLFDIKPCPF